MSETLTCKICPCKHSAACIEAAFKNGKDFGERLSKEVRQHIKNNEAKK